MIMENSGINITPKTKVGELLDKYPDLEKVLISMSPAFEKLRNPILRKTVARVATLQQIAVIGNLQTDELVNRLRKETGQESADVNGESTDYLSASAPGWFDKSKIVQSFDASPVINSGGSPMADILRMTQSLSEKEILELKTPFVPAPVIDILRSRGFSVHCVQEDGSVSSYIARME